MSEAIIKKDGTDYPLQTMPLHYPADRVYLNGDTSKTVQDVLTDNSTFTSGYKVFPDGLKIIWGVTQNVVVVPSAYDTLIEEIVLPVSMSNTNYRISCVNNMGWPVIPFVYNKTATGFKIYGGNPFSTNMNATIEYIVIGY